MKALDPLWTLIAKQAGVKTCHCFHTYSAIKEMGRQFHIGAFAAFAGLEERHVTAIMDALAVNSAMPATRATPARQAIRLPIDWTLSGELAEWAMFKRRWEPSIVQAEAEKFANFWHGKSGANATKVDWDATWRNWVLNSNRPDGIYNPNVAPKNSQDQRAALEARAALYERMGRDTEAEEIRRHLAKNNVIPLRA